MKTLKYLIITCILGFTNCTIGQNSNILSGEEYSSIKINNINIDNIIETKGDKTQMDILFGFSFLLNSDNEFIKTRELRNDIQGIYIYFEDDLLYTYKISNNKSNLTIKGVKITIGNHISKLGNVKTNNSNEIKFSTNETNDVIRIEFNSLNKTITSIQYKSLD